MTINACKWLLATALALNLSTAGATIILDTPTTLSVRNVVDDNITLLNRDASLMVDTGGSVRTVRVYEGALDVSGAGRVIGGIGLGGGRSTARLSDQATVSGSIRSDFSAGWDDESQSTVKLYLQDQAMVAGDINYSGYLRIQDQAFVGGNVMNIVSGNVRVDMSGGLIAGYVRLGAGNSMLLNLDGGTILGDIEGIWGDLGLQMTGGTIDGGIRTGASVNGEISGGRIGNSVLIAASGPSSNLRITGGQFDAALDNWLFQFANEPGAPAGNRSGQLEIWGGQFGYASAGQGFLINDLMNLSVYGRDLVYSNGWLTGYLMDGSWFNNALTFGTNWQGTFTIHNVPEPETLALFLVGLVGVAVSRRGRPRVV